MPRASRPAITTLLMVVSIVAISLCLRSPIISVSPLLDTIQDDLGLSATIMGLLSTLPPICFGLVAHVAPRIARKAGIDLAIVGLVAVLGVGIAVRSLPPIAALFGGTVIVGSAIAVGNVLMPALVKRDFPEKSSLMTAVYVMAISTGGAAGAGLTIPLQHYFDLSWRGALAIWIAPVIVALLVLIPQLAGKRRMVVPQSEAQRPRLWRDRIAWYVSFFMGLQSFMFFAVNSWIPKVLIDDGMSADRAGLLLSISGIFGLFSSFAAPILAQKGPDQRWLVATVLGIWCFSIAGLAYAPGTMTLLWMVTFGIGAGAALSLGLSLIVLRSPDTLHAAALSGMAQGVGYLIASIGPFMVGALHDLVGGWRIPLTVALLFLIPTLLAGLGAGKKRFVGQLAS